MLSRKELEWLNARPKYNVNHDCAETGIWMSFGWTPFDDEALQWLKAKNTKQYEWWRKLLYAPTCGESDDFDDACDVIIKNVFYSDAAIFSERTAAKITEPVSFTICEMCPEMGKDHCNELFIRRTGLRCTSDKAEPWFILKYARLKVEEELGKWALDMPVLK